MNTKRKNRFKSIKKLMYIITFIFTFIILTPVLSQEVETFEEFKDSERNKIDSAQKKILKMKISKDTSKQVRMRHRGSMDPDFTQKDTIVKHKRQINKRNCDSKDVFIDKDGDGINDSRQKGMGLGKRKGLGKGKCKQEEK